MVTISHNDYCPELLAAIRRETFAAPAEEDKVEHLVVNSRSSHQTMAFEHVLSLEWCVQAAKQHFFVRNKRTPLGHFEDWWDRTEVANREHNKARERERILRSERAHTRGQYSMSVRL